MGEVAIQTKSSLIKGTTTAAYVEALRVDTRGCGVQGKTVIQITNKSEDQTMYYKIDGYLADPTGALGGTAIAKKAETSIAAATTVVNTDVAQVYAAVVVSVVNNSAACAYQIEYCTY
ncbi:hypothetical protein CCP3SC15_420026 [Gammaproteobacteria bacterium]